MALKKKLDCFWTLSLCLVASRVSKALNQIPRLPTINDPVFIKECVDNHNEMRSKVTPSAANMNYLTWDKKLAALAKSWSKECKYFHNPCSEKRFGCVERHEFVGENLYLGGIRKTPRDIISSWFNESKHYVFDNMTCFRTCSHYTQLVWATSLKVGCGVSNCPHLIGSSAALFICYYAPGKSNKDTQPYIKGEPCSLCEGHECINNLCGPLIQKAPQLKACHLLLLGFILQIIL